MKLRAYFSILRIKLISGLQYRVAALAGFAINMFWGILLTTILILFYRLGNPKGLNMTLAQGVTYIWLGQCFISFIPMQPDSEVYQKISSGDFAYELCRPLDLYFHWYARAAALRLSNAVLKSSLGLVFCFLLPEPYKMKLPASAAAAAATMLALTGALLLSCSLSNLMNTFLLKVELGPGLNSLLLAVITLLSGLVVPISIFPEWLQPLLRLLPFAGLMDFPAALYSGILPVSAAPLMLLKQAVWTLLLVLLGRRLLAKGLKKTVIQGG